ncbi:MAG: hypothetical protein A2W05_06640 [Candidatus Schekmanbacteria bacterium RBG_16_38_10]|uniref:HTH cro/C1-type domain-containing protein n=1 Tax=Candidatus Schekmanbacteria bacterium RBG_16_38_10 TaxID=1817879 RepID=A0A1F7RSW3_9BACT|nr:MAG: hypothetical protein A2W05_06640 [Candidatus Schekmanbacteria bacterium RBG_16_38_10]
MNLKRDWLWDRKITVKEAKSILSNPENERFLSLSVLLLSRKNSPKEVFNNYLDPSDFLKNWHKIKRWMRRDNWNNPRIEFWQAIHDKLKEKFKKKGLFPVKEKVASKMENEFFEIVADKIKAVRKKKGITQSQLAKKLKISQQMISRIENGTENISLFTLRKIVDSLGATLHLEISEKKGGS